MPLGNKYHGNTQWARLRGDSAWFQAHTAGKAAFARLLHAAQKQLQRTRNTLWGHQKTLTDRRCLINMYVLGLCTVESIGRGCSLVNVVNQVYVEKRECVFVETATFCGDGESPHGCTFDSLPDRLPTIQPPLNIPILVL